jgi:hypothetical protein
LTDNDHFGRSLCLAVDAEGYSARFEDEQADLQSDLTRILSAAGLAARLGIGAWDVQPQGDGQLVLARLDDTEPRYLDEFVRQLDHELTRHNRSRVPEARLRLRIALHHGVAYPAANGFVGDAVVLVSRLLDAPIARRALAESEANLVLIVSPAMYHDNILAEHTSLNPLEFTEVKVEGPKVNTDAWIWLPPAGRSETLQQARARKGGVVQQARRDVNAPAIQKQKAQTITNVDNMRVKTAHFGTTVTRAVVDD